MAAKKSRTTDEKPAPAPAPEPPAPVPAQALATTGQAELIALAPEYLREGLARTAGQGISTAPEDSIVPFVLLLQKLSPELKKNHEKFVPNAEAGDFYLKGAIKPLIKAAEGLTVQSCGVDKAWVEWIPRPKGGGFVQRWDWDKRPDDVVERTDPENPRRTKLMRPNGNEIVETRYHFILHNLAPYVLTFTSTGHTTSKEWMNMMKVLAATEGALSSYSRKYRLVPKLRTRLDQEWFVLAVEDKGWVTHREFEAGEAFNTALKTGAKVLGEEDAGGKDTDEKAPF